MGYIADEIRVRKPEPPEPTPSPQPPEPEVAQADQAWRSQVFTVGVSVLNAPITVKQWEDTMVTADWNDPPVTYKEPAWLSRIYDAYGSCIPEGQIELTWEEVVKWGVPEEHIDFAESSGAAYAIVRL